MLAQRQLKLCHKLVLVGWQLPLPLLPKHLRRQKMLLHALHWLRPAQVFVPNLLSPLQKATHLPRLLSREAKIMKFFVIRVRRQTVSRQHSTVANAVAIFARSAMPPSILLTTS